MGKLIDLTGQVFGRLTVLYRGPNSPGGRAQWHCLCQCGNKTLVLAKDLRSGNTRSCGCLHRSLASDRMKRLHEKGHPMKGRPGPWAGITGEGTPAWTGDDVSYDGQHQRIRKGRGPASEYTCVDCGDPAQEWSYVGNCPDEKVGDHSGFTVAYCAHLEHFAPRCIRDHRLHDGNPIATGEHQRAKAS